MKADDSQPTTQPVKETPKVLPKVDKHYQSLANVEYIRDEKVRNEFTELIDSIEKIEGVDMRKTSNHDLTVMFEGKSLVRLCPLRADYSSSINGSSIGDHSRADIMRAITKGIEQRKEEIEKARIEAEKIAQKEAEEKAKVEAEAKAKEQEEKKKVATKKK